MALPMHMLTPASEGPMPFPGPMPPDQQPIDLAGALAMADQIMWRDGGVTDDEMQIFTAWVQMQMLKMQQAQQQQQGGMSPEQQGLGDSSVQPYNPFGGGEGAQDRPDAYMQGGY